MRFHIGMMMLCGFLWVRCCYQIMNYLLMNWYGIRDARMVISNEIRVCECSSIDILGTNRIANFSRSSRCFRQYWGAEIQSEIVKMVSVFKDSSWNSSTDFSRNYFQGFPQNSFPNSSWNFAWDSFFNSFQKFYRNYTGTFLAERLHESVDRFPISSYGTCAVKF